MSESLKDKIIKLLSAFREPMCRRLCDDPTCACRREAGAAIALVVEEAALVVRAHRDTQVAVQWDWTRKVGDVVADDILALKEDKP